MKKYLLLCFLVFIVFSCEVEKEEKPHKVKYNYTEEERYTTVQFGSAGKAVYTININEPKTIYLVKGNKSRSKAVSGSKSGSAKIISADIKNFSVTDSKSVINKKSDSGFLRLPNERAMFFNSKALPPERDDLLKRTSTVAYTYGNPNSKYIIGETQKKFQVEDKDKAFTEIDTTLRGIGNFCYVWVSDKNWGDGVNQVNQENINNLIEKFDGKNNDYLDGKNNDYLDGIYKLVTNVFGDEYGGGDDGHGGVDKDQHISFLIYDIDFDYDPKGENDTGVLGYFWGKDHYTDEELKTLYPEQILKSNYMEMLYLDANFMKTREKLMYSTLAHELQHLISFNQKNIKAGKSPSTWFNEMMSMVCEDLIADKLDIEDKDKPSRWFGWFNEFYYESGVNDWIGNKSYATSYAFGSYLARNYEGVNLINKISINANVDVGAVIDGLINYDPNGITDIDTVFKKYAEALIYESSSEGEELMLFNREVSSFLNGIYYNLEAINIWDIESANKENPSKGPKILKLDEKPDLRKLGYSIHSDDKLKNVTGTLKIEIVKPDSPDVFFYLMFK